MNTEDKNKWKQTKRHTLRNNTQKTIHRKPRKYTRNKIFYTHKAADTKT